jgi:hypothetical protein
MQTRPLHHHYIWANQHRCVTLFAGLVIYILVLPLVFDLIAGRLILYIAIVVLMIGVIRSIRPSGGVLYINVGLGVLFIALIILAVSTRIPWLFTASAVVVLLFFLGVMVALLRYVMDTSRVTADKLFGAVSLYILVAFSFAIAYALLEGFGHRHFAFSEADNPAARLDWSDFLYFSFTVLTSTGFGEITPASRLARSFVIIQQVTGVMYVAFLIARLTELYPSRPKP